jgi:hypothetical protein
MKKYIITTTINEPTEATIKFCEIADKKDFTFVIVGDTKTPHESYQKLVESYLNVVYLTPGKQEHLYPELSEIIGWKTIQRRNIGLVYAYQSGAEIIATVDDDNHCDSAASCSCACHTTTVRFRDDIPLCLCGLGIWPLNHHWHR